MITAFEPVQITSIDESGKPIEPHSAYGRLLRIEAIGSKLISYVRLNENALNVQGDSY